MKKYFFTTFVLALIIFPVLVLADAPPPPPFTVYINYNGQRVSDPKLQAEILRCDEQKILAKGSIAPKLLIAEYDAKNKCTWEPQNISNRCSVGQCWFNWAMGEFKVAVYLPSVDKVFISNSLTRRYAGYYGHDTVRFYQAELFGDGQAKIFESSDQGQVDNPVVTTNSDTSTTTAVEDIETVSFTTNVVVLLLITLFLELIVVLIFLAIKKVSKKILLGVLLGNIISVPLLWLVVSSAYWTLLPAEIIAVIFEAWLIKLFAKEKLSWKMCLLISLIMNIISFLFGPFLISLI
ncbi:MAG: hypothetical protein NTV48_01895 [Candidatus Vogelbacteria bacterium]|nr:hypothetical protein [Candidatus Vogelbacteria bacterium]